MAGLSYMLDAQRMCKSLLLLLLPKLVKETSLLLLLLRQRPCEGTQQRM